ncbi:phospholipid-transporting ATPase ABCA1-like [Watersipora subatra]|uniref:phospholipid-transporting ATPase ABCA1-like n=1 Tax=Watersipora subatra TaxID=2589382 RepID=UPI00355B1F74
MEATSRAGLTGVKKLARQYKLLMWKNLLLLSRSPFRIAVEITWPLVLFFILALVRSRETLVQWNPECHFHNKPMPSAGMLPFFQGMMCLSNNTCFDHEVADELSGRLTSFETTGVERLVNDTATFLSNDTQTQVLYNAVTEMAKISDALQTLQSNRNSLGSLLALDEPSFYQKLEESGIPLTNRTADLLFNNVTLNSSALLDELGRIQDRNPAFIPLLETFLVDLVTFRTLLTNDSQLWAKALTEDFVESLASVPNIDLSPDSVLDRVAADGINFGNIDMTDLLGKIQGASSPEDLQNIIANATSAAGIGEQVMNVVALSASQRQALDEFCDEDQNKNSSACLLGQILSDNSTNAAAAVRELCSQSRYDGLVTCTLFDFTNVSNVIEASAVVENLCEHHIISNTSLCAMAEVQQHLLKILENASSSEVLCNADSTVLIYDSPEIESEVETPMCNLNDTQQKLLLDILVEHINTTALREVYFPDGFDPEVLLELAKQLQQLRDMPSVQVPVPLDSVMSGQDH